MPRKKKRAPIVLPPGADRAYAMGPVHAVFKADGDETRGRYSISEWWLEPYTRGPGAHTHEEDVMTMNRSELGYLLFVVLSLPILWAPHWSCSGGTGSGGTGSGGTGSCPEDMGIYGPPIDPCPVEGADCAYGDLDCVTNYLCKDGKWVEQPGCLSAVAASSGGGSTASSSAAGSGGSIGSGGAAGSGGSGGTGG